MYFYKSIKIFQMEFIQTKNLIKLFFCSRRCLEETNWDFQRAGFVFTELNKQNKIPIQNWR